MAKQKLPLEIRIRHRVMKTDNTQFDVVDCYTGLTASYYSTYAEAKAFANELNDAWFDEIAWSLHNQVCQMQLELILVGIEKEA